MELPQGYGLLPITSGVSGRLGGGGGVKPFGDVFWFLSGVIEALARRISLAGAVAYVEAEIFAGTGTQAMVLWCGGEVCLGPVITQVGSLVPELSSSVEWAFNQAFRRLGADRGGAVDEFEALGLGRWRRTEDWVVGGPA